MALIKCPDCQSDVSDLAPACPRCGRPIVARTIESTENRPSDERRTESAVHTDTPHPRGSAEISARGGALDAAVLNLAGWLSMLNAGITIPMVILSFALTSLGGGARVLNACLSVAGAILSVYLLSRLRDLLNVRFRFHQADSVIKWFIGLTILVTAFSVLIPENMVVSIVMLIALAIVEVALGVILLRMPGELYGLLKPYAYTSIGTGICWGTVILLLFGLLGSILQDVILAMIFFRAAQEQTIGRVE